MCARTRRICRTRPRLPIVNLGKKGGGPNKKLGSGSKPASRFKVLSGRTGERNRRFTRNSECHLAPESPLRKSRKRSHPVFSPPPDRAPRPSFSSISTDARLSAFKARSSALNEAGRNCDQSVPATLGAGNQLICTKEDSMVILGTGATANPVSLRWLQNRSSAPAKRGFPRVETHPATARLKFGDRRMGEVGHAAGITAGKAGEKGSFTALSQSWQCIFMREEEGKGRSPRETSAQLSAILDNLGNLETRSPNNGEDY